MAAAQVAAAGVAREVAAEIRKADPDATDADCDMLIPGHAQELAQWLKVQEQQHVSLPLEVDDCHNTHFDKYWEDILHNEKSCPEARFLTLFERGGGGTNEGGITGYRGSCITVSNKHLASDGCFSTAS